MKEALTSFETVSILAPVALAFLREIAKEIGKRDKWTCQDCGRKWSDGWLVDVAHYPDHHRKDDPAYQETTSGRVLCLECHEKEHENLGQPGSAQLIENRRKPSEGHTYFWRRNI
jgi:hypothetical protein